MDEIWSVVHLSGQGGQRSFTFPGPDQTQGMVVLWQQLKVVVSSPPAHPSSALPHQPRKLQKGRAGARNPALLDLAHKVALSCHRSCLSSTQWPPRPPSHRWESHRQAARTATALTAQEPAGTSVTLGCFCLQTARRCRGRGTSGAPGAAAVQHLVLHQCQNFIPQGHNRSQSPGHSVRSWASCLQVTNPTACF